MKKGNEHPVIHHSRKSGQRKGTGGGGNRRSNLGVRHEREEKQRKPRQLCRETEGAKVLDLNPITLGGRSLPQNRGSRGIVIGNEKRRGIIAMGRGGKQKEGTNHEADLAGPERVGKKKDQGQNEATESSHKHKTVTTRLNQEKKKGLGKRIDFRVRFAPE